MANSWDWSVNKKCAKWFFFFKFQKDYLRPKKWISFIFVPDFFPWKSAHPQNLSSGQRHILMRQWWQSFKINELLLFLGSWVSHWICATDASKWPRLIWWPVSQMTPSNIWLSLLPQKMKHPILFKSWAKSVTDLMRCETGGDGEAPTASREKLPQIAIALVAFYFPKKCPCCNLFLKIRISCIKVMPVSSTFKIALFTCYF